MKKPDTTPFPTRVRRALALSRAALLAERAARAFWPALTLVLFTLAVALLGGFELLSGSLHRIVLAALAIALLGALVVGALRLRVPSRREAARRLDAETASRPVSTLADTLAAGRGTVAETIWAAHLARARTEAERLRATAPDLALARHDTWALRLLALVLLVGGILAARGDWSDRVASIFSPIRVAAGGPLVTARAPSAEAWAVPPPHTGLDTVYLTDLERDTPVPALPQGSALTIRVADYDGTPTLQGDVLSGFEGFVSYGGGLAEAQGVLDRSGGLTVRAGDTMLADWVFEVTPDDPPTIALTGDPGGTQTGALEVPFVTRDDYGVITAWADIEPAGGLVKGRGLIDEPISFALPLPLSGRALEVEERAERDLTAHPWAGAEVEMVLTAEDGAAQRGQSEMVRFVLPERRFTNPMARALVEQRRELALDFAEGARVLDVLQAVTRRPDEIFEGTHGAYMGVRTAIRRLAVAVTLDTVPQVAGDVTELLWLAALALEEGELADALEKLRQAEQRLRDALENGSEQEIADAIEAMREAMNEYLQQLMAQAMQNPPQPGQQQQGGEQLSSQDLQEMLDQLQRNAEQGLRDQARDMLSQLSQMLQNLQAGTPQMQPGQGQSGQAMQDLQELIQRQRDLADQTFDELRQQRRSGQQGRQGQQGGRQPGQQGQQGTPPGQQPGEGQGQGDGMGQQQPGQQGMPQPGQDGRPGGSLGEQQQALREALDALRERLEGMGADTGPLGEAGREMGEAVEDLQGDRNADAVQDQMEALDRLNEGANQLAEQMQNGQGQAGAEGQGRGQEGRASDDMLNDPFDRPQGAYGAVDGRDTNVPDRSALDRARELLEELRRRSAEPQRPPLELDYLDRLMDRF